MNMQKILDAIVTIKSELLKADPTEKEYAEYGRAVADAVRDRYDIGSVSTYHEENTNWKDSAKRVWRAAGRLGLR